MLIKKELQDLPLSPAPDPTKRVPLTAGAAVHRLPKCGDILAVDVYGKRELFFRFFSDGKNFITWRARPDVPSWTKRDPFIAENIRYHPVKAESSSMGSISQVLEIKLRSRDVLEQVEECLAQFIARYYKQKKERALEAKYRLMEQHLDMFPTYPSDLDEFCENHVFHKSIVYLSKLIEGQRWGWCMHGGERFRLDRSVKPCSEGICPKCGVPARFRGEWAEKPIISKAKICIPYLVDGQVLLQYAKVQRRITPQEDEPEYEYSDFFLNVFSENNGRQKAYAYYWRQCLYYWPGWGRLRNGSVCFSDTYVYTENLSEMRGLIATIKQADTAYFRDDRPTMSDRDYDVAVDPLKNLEQDTGVILSDSPTQKVPGEILESLTEVRHTRPMLSADKTKSVDDLVRFAGGRDVVLSWKMDGLTLVLRYDGGQLQQAITRGREGIIGEDVTHTVRTFLNVPLTVPTKEPFEVRGEGVISWENFRKINDNLDEPYTHPRNLAAGSVRKLDPAESRKRLLEFKAFDLVTEFPFTTKTEHLDFLTENGFSVVPHLRLISPNAEAIKDKVLVLVREGVLCLPYDGFDGENCEFFNLADAKLLTAGQIAELSRHWQAFSNGLVHAMNDMEEYLREKEGDSK